MWRLVLARLQLLLRLVQLWGLAAAGSEGLQLEPVMKYIGPTFSNANAEVRGAATTLTVQVGLTDIHDEGPTAPQHSCITSHSPLSPRCLPYSLSIAKPVHCQLKAFVNVSLERTLHNESVMQKLVKFDGTLVF